MCVIARRIAANTMQRRPLRRHHSVVILLCQDIRIVSSSFQRFQSTTQAAHTLWHFSLIRVRKLKAISRAIQANQRAKRMTTTTDWAQMCSFRCWICRAVQSRSKRQRLNVKTQRWARAAVKRRWKRRARRNWHQRQHWHRRRRVTRISPNGSILRLRVEQRNWWRPWMRLAERESYASSQQIRFTATNTRTITIHLSHRTTMKMMTMRSSTKMSTMCRHTRILAASGSQASVLIDHWQRRQLDGTNDGRPATIKVQLSSRRHQPKIWTTWIHRRRTRKANGCLAQRSRSSTTNRKTCRTSIQHSASKCGATRAIESFPRVPSLNVIFAQSCIWNTHNQRLTWSKHRCRCLNWHRSKFQRNRKAKSPATVRYLRRSGRNGIVGAITSSAQFVRHDCVAISTAST